MVTPQGSDLSLAQADKCSARATKTLLEASRYQVCRKPEQRRRRATIQPTILFSYRSFMCTQPQTILIVDDDPHVGPALKRALSISGYQVELHSSAEECLSAAVTSAATCLVIDVHLGTESGIDLAKNL